MHYGRMEPDIIDRLGGAKALAEALGLTKQAVTNWRLGKRGIPWRHRPAIARLAADRAEALPIGFWDGTAA